MGCSKTPQKLQHPWEQYDLDERDVTCPLSSILMICVADHCEGAYQYSANR